MKQIFKSIKIKDPLTGEERILSPEEQEELLEKGVYLGQSTSNFKKPKNIRS